MIAKNGSIAYNEQCSFTNKTGRAGAINTPLTLTNVSNQETTMANDQYSNSPIPAQPHTVVHEIIYNADPFQFTLIFGGEHDGILLTNPVDVIWMHEIEPSEFKAAFEDAVDAHSTYSTYFNAIDNPSLDHLAREEAMMLYGNLTVLLENETERFDDDEIEFLKSYRLKTAKRILETTSPRFRAIARYIPRSSVGGGYVYVVQSPTHAYKIGRTKNPNDRMRTFGIQLPFEVSYLNTIRTPDMYGLERFFHEMFAEKRINGEWFALSDEDLQIFRLVEFYFGGAE